MTELSDDIDIRMLLLSYNDFSIEKDIEKKRKILFDLGAWLEPQRTKYTSINSNLTSDIFNVLNNGSIRHNNSKQWSFSSEEDKLKMYDDLFKMIIHLIRQEDIKKIHDKISSFNV